MVSAIEVARALGGTPDPRAVHAALVRAREAGAAQQPWPRAAAQWLVLLAGAAG